MFLRIVRYYCDHLEVPCVHFVTWPTPSLAFSQRYFMAKMAKHITWETIAARYPFAIWLTCWLRHFQSVGFLCELKRGPRKIAISLALLNEVCPTYRGSARWVGI